MKKEEKLSELINSLSGVLEKGDPAATVSWVREYATLSESMYYGTTEHIKEIGSIFNAHGIVAGMHEKKQRKTSLVGESAKTWSEFIAGQLLYFDINPLYFSFASDRFLQVHNNKQKPALRNFD